MSVTFENLIAHNKRVSFWLVLGLGVVVSLVSGVFLTALSQEAGSEDVVPIFLFGSGLGSVAAIIGSFVSYFKGSQIILGITGARQVSSAQDPELCNVVEEMSIAGGVPPPKIYLIDDPSPNAFATGRDPAHAAVAITTGLRQKLSRDELQAVMAHEMAHIKNYDIRLMMLVGVFAGIIVLLADFFLRSLRRGSLPARPAQSSTDGKSNSGGLMILFLVLGFILAILAPFIARFLQLAVSREREYLADATAVQLCRNPLALVSALKKISLAPEKLKCDNRALQHLFIVNPDPKRRLTRADLDSVWSTHPPMIKRIQRLLKLSKMSDSPESLHQQ